MKAWYKTVGYYQNPLLLNPFKDKTPFLGQKKPLKDALYYIRSGSMLFIEGKKGAGKTKFLTALIPEFRGRVIYLNAKRIAKSANIEKLLKKRNGLRGQVFGKKPKHMVLFIDNVTALSKVNYERIKYFFDQGYLQSVVFTGTSFTKTQLPESIRSRIGKRVIRLEPLAQEEALQIVSKRLDEDLEDEDALINASLVKRIYEASYQNPRLFLIWLQRVFDEMHFEKDEVVSQKHLGLLKDNLNKKDVEDIAVELGESPENKEALVDEKGNKIVQIGEYYRVPAYEMFCDNCGAIVTQEDTTCPECKAEFEGEQQ